MTAQARPAEPGPAPAVWALALLLLALLLWDGLGLDAPVTRLFGSADGFAWRDAWLTRTVLHDGARRLAWAVFAALALLALRAPAAQRRQRLYWLAVILGTLVVVPALKRWSLTSCPWDLAEFGGTARWVSHWSGLLAPAAGDGGPGRCFPSGHASVAFGFIGLAPMWRDSHPRRARWALGVVLTAGAVLGLAQMSRGAHHASHVLWSLWLCAALAIAADAVARRWWPRPGA